MALWPLTFGDIERSDWACCWEFIGRLRGEYKCSSGWPDFSSLEQCSIRLYFDSNSLLMDFLDRLTSMEIRLYLLKQSFWDIMFLPLSPPPLPLAIRVQTLLKDDPSQFSESGDCRLEGILDFRQNIFKKIFKKKYCKIVNISNFNWWPSWIF